MESKIGWIIFVSVMLGIIAVGTFIFLSMTYSQNWSNFTDSSSVPSIPSVPSVPSVPSAPNFLASPNFNGAKMGYVFKNGNNGVGYYKDELNKLF